MQLLSLRNNHAVGMLTPIPVIFHVADVLAALGYQNHLLNKLIKMFSLTAFPQREVHWV